MTEKDQNDPVKNLAKSILVRLENQKYIALDAYQRTKAFEEADVVLKKNILSENDLKQKVFARLSTKEEELSHTDIGQNDKFRTAKAMVKTELDLEEMKGFYIAKSLKFIAEEFTKFLFTCKAVDEVFEDDTVIERHIIESIKKFDPASRA